MYFLSFSNFFFFFFFFFNDTATTEIYTLSLHDALPILPGGYPPRLSQSSRSSTVLMTSAAVSCSARSEEHTSELQSRRDLVCRLLLEKKKKKKKKLKHIEKKKKNTQKIKRKI